MGKEYVRLEIQGDRLEDVYKKMIDISLSSRRKIECEFNGKIINSDMDIEEAHFKYCGITYSESKRLAEEYNRKVRQRYQAFQASREKNTLIYKERGAELISPDKLSSWYKDVDDYMELAPEDTPMFPIALDMIEKAKLGATKKDLIEFIKQIDCKQLDCSIYVKDIAIAAADRYCSEINGLRAYIQTYRTLQGTPDYIIFPDEKGMAMVDEYLKARESVLKEIMEKWPQIVDKNHAQDLAELLVAEERGIYTIYQIQDCLEIVGALNRGMDLDDVKDILDQQNHTKDNWIIMTSIKNLCDRGKELDEYVKECERESVSPVIGDTHG